MTVGETIASSSMVQGPPVQVAPPIQVGQVAPSSQPLVVGQVQQNPSGQIIGSLDPSSGMVRGNPSSAHPPPTGGHQMAAKVNQEVLTSLHFIKDIRRLEKYQRDFFLKVTKLVHSLRRHLIIL